MLDFLFWFFVGPAALAALLSVRSGRSFQDYAETEILGEADPDEAAYQPPATLFLPVRGVDHDLASNLRSLAHQDYPDYEIVVVCRDEADPAVPVVRMTLGERCRVVIAGAPPAGTGEKVHNLLAAVREARAESEVFVFADSDGQVSEKWLATLVQPLGRAGDEQTGATTAFRWYFPEEGGFWPLMRSAWDSTIAGQMRGDGKNFAWGGGMAVPRRVFESARVAEFWKGSISDDYRLTTAMNEAGLGIRFVPGAMVATTGACTKQEFLDWATRQLVITRVYRRNIWIAGLVAHIVYCGAMVMCLAMTVTGELIGPIALMFTQTPGMAKGAMRGYVGRLMFPAREDWFDRFGSVYFWYTPLATWIWLWVFLRSAGTRTIRWRDYVYELESPDRTRTIAAP